jgi:peptide/nickel transport system substrate-binding protein
MLAPRVAAGQLPAVERRLPAPPRVVSVAEGEGSIGQYGGDLRLLMARSKDVRMAVVYGYARLMGYDQDFELLPDLLASIEVREDREFTLRLRRRHRWSDGHPFTTEDFRYYWQDIANDDGLSPFGVPAVLTVDGEPPTVEILGETRVRYTWEKPNPFFLPALAGTRPLYIYAPAHYLKQFHARYADPQALAKTVKATGQRDWVALHYRMYRPYKNTNPQLPTLQPWINTTAGPSERFVFERNPYYHRVDEAGQQLPYLDRVIMNIADAKLIPAKTGAGESDLQARHLKFSDYTFLKESEERNNTEVRLWETTKGAHVALFPNLNARDPVWRNLFRDARFRRALSLAINRHEINQVLYYGLAIEGNNIVHRRSPLFRPRYRSAWARFDLDEANALLDELGLTQRNARGIRLLPDGRPMNLVVETAGEDTEQTDVLSLVRDTWLAIGIKLFSKPMQREVFRNRIFAGESLVSIWGGLENAVPTADMSPRELAPTSQQQLQWPKWGQFFETKEEAGEAVDLPAAEELLRLNRAWASAPSSDARERIWHQMLAIHADQVFSIGIISAVPQPVVVSRELRNVPMKGIYNWEPGAHFGIYRPDTFWFQNQ